MLPDPGVTALRHWSGRNLRRGLSRITNENAAGRKAQPMRSYDSRPPKSGVVLVGALLGVGLFVVAACSSSSKASVNSGQPAAGATVLSRSTSSGTVLTDVAGKPLYTFANDQAGATTSACTGGCASAWPPLTASGAPVAGPGVNGTLAKLASGQVTWDGHPLYTFASDSPGASPTGDGVSGFHLAMAAGSNSGITATTSAGYHY
jgi:predicted lipoprotein with Yx(FWY)xxD motif